MDKGPNLKSLLTALELPVSNYLLKKVGSKQHRLNFVTAPRAPFSIPSNLSILYDNPASPDRYHHELVQRTIDFHDLGILCSSGTRPALREITLSAKLDEQTKIEFGQKHTLREGFEGEDEQYGSGKQFSVRIDYAKRQRHTDQSSELLVMEPGIVHYPFWATRTGLYHRPIWKKHEQELGEKPVLSAEEKATLREDFESDSRMISVDIVVLLDAGELLAFHWDWDLEKFRGDIYNVGLVPD